VKVIEQKLIKDRQPSKLEETFRRALVGPGHDLPRPQMEYRFILALPEGEQRYYLTPKTRKPRQWAFDFAWIAYHVAVEIDGGMFMASGGRHNSAVDRAKMAAADRLGWMVLHFTAPELRNSRNCIEQVRAALLARGWKEGKEGKGG
jgi:hypothetical protein